MDSSERDTELDAPVSEVMSEPEHVVPPVVDGPAKPVGLGPWCLRVRFSRPRGVCG